jgi:carbon-monoxide dehydrogenase medium subunit
VQAEVPLLSAVARTVGDPQIRHRGTLGGSLAHADPASDLPAAVLALGGSVVLRSPRGTRTGPDHRLLHRGVLLGEGARRADRRGPGPAHRVGRLGLREVHPPGQRLGDRRGRRGRRPGGLVNMGPTPLRASATEAALADGAAIADAAALAAEGTDPPEDVAGTKEYRRHLARVLTRRALTTAAEG